MTSAPPAESEFLFSGGLVRAGDQTESRRIEPGTDLSDLEEALLESNPAFGADPVELEPGAVFGDLEVRGKLGAGGMATVYRAWDPEQETDVALKLLNRGLVSDTRHLRRFRREARLAARLRHPRIVTTHAYGEIEGNAYLTMQLVEGPTLADVIDEEGPLPPLRAAEVLELVARAIDAAHRQRVVHRDLKPSNIMLHPEDGPLVLDFGLAKDLARDPQLTETGEILGTPAFLAPEQVAARCPLDHRLDIYGLGATLFFVLTGRQPHLGESALEVLQRLMTDEPPRLREVDPEIPAPLELIVAKALARDPRDRYQTAQDLADDLHRYRAQSPVRAKLPGRLQRLARAAHRHPKTSALVVLLIALVAGTALSVRGLASRLALHQRSQDGIELLEQAHVAAAAGRHQDADPLFLQAMLVTKGAFLEDPQDDELRAALARVKRERAVYAESRGNWSLAEELRQNLARLEGSEPVLQELDREAPATLRIHGFSNAQERVVLHGLSGAGSIRIAEATRAAPLLELHPGQYLAVHTRPGGRVARTYLLVVDAGSRHRIHLGQSTPPPPGVFLLPRRETLARAQHDIR